MTLNVQILKHALIASARILVSIPSIHVGQMLSAKPKLIDQCASAKLDIWAIHTQNVINVSN